MAEARETLQNREDPHGCEEKAFTLDDFVTKLGSEVSGISLGGEELTASDQPQFNRSGNCLRVSRSISTTSSTGDTAEGESEEINKYTTILRNFYTRATPKVIYQDLRKTLDDWQTVHINIGIIGASGTGKSTLINTLRRLKPEDPGAAEVDAVQTTVEPTPYSYPKNPRFRLWDLPGVGTPDFTKENYLSRINFGKYDFFLIVCSTRFTENDFWFACELQPTGKKFYFVRTKVDIDIRNDREDHPSTHNRNQLLDKIRRDCAHHLPAENFGDLFVALVCKDPKAFDFPRLEEKMILDLKDFQRDAMIFTLQTATVTVIKEKTASLLRRVRYISYAAGAAAVLPGLSTLLSAGLIYEELRLYKKTYGLNKERLNEIIEDKKLSKDDIDCVIGQNFWVNVTVRSVLSAMSSKVSVSDDPSEPRKKCPFWKELVSVFTFAHNFRATPQLLRSSIASMESAALIILDKFVVTASDRYRDTEYASAS